MALGGHALAQDAPSTVSFNGIGFSFDPSLGTSVNITSVPGQSGAQVSRRRGTTAHRFSLYGSRQETGKTRARQWPVVRVYSVADMAATPVLERADSLQGLLRSARISPASWCRRPTPALGRCR